MRTRMYGGVRGRKTKVGGKPTFVFLLLDFLIRIFNFLIALLHALFLHAEHIPQQADDEIRSAEGGPLLGIADFRVLRKEIDGHASGVGQ